MTTREPDAEGAVVRVKFKDKRQFKKCYVKDISRNGIFLKTKTPLDVFADVTLVLELHDGQEIPLHGTVVHVVPPSRAGANVSPGMGIQFTDLTAEKKRKLELYLKSYKTIPPGSATQVTRTQEIAAQKRPADVPGELDERLQALRRLLWLAADATRLASCDYYQLLGVEPTATSREIQEAVALLRSVIHPGNPPAGVDTHDPSRISAIELVLSDIEGCLTDARRRKDYDARRPGR